MEDQQHELLALGWNEWFDPQATPAKTESIARVAAIDRDLMFLVDQTGHFRAKLSGSFRRHHHLSHELPCVGDWVRVERQASDGYGLVTAVLKRKTALRRKFAGKVIESQIIAANIDFVVIVQSCHLDFNLNRLQRYLVMVMDGGAQPCILLTKTDLVSPKVLAAQLEEIRSSGVTAPILTLSNVTGKGVAELKRGLLPRKTYCFVGSSGVGKSTLINLLMGRDALETGDLSETGEGRHITVRRELISLEGGALVIDNPGMREIGILGAESGIDSSYSDIFELASNCRFRDCTHNSEPGCAVLKAVQSGVIGKELYENYLKICHESKFYQMSHVQKRQKDRSFGKFIKSAKKDLRERY